MQSATLRSGVRAVDGPPDDEGPEAAIGDFFGGSGGSGGFVGHGWGRFREARSSAQPTVTIAAASSGQTSRNSNQSEPSGRYCSRNGTCHIRSVSATARISATSCHR